MSGDDDDPERQQQPGELYDVNKQCEQAYGPGSRLCPYEMARGTADAVRSTLPNLPQKY